MRATQCRYNDVLSAINSIEKKENTNNVRIGYHLRFDRRPITKPPKMAKSNVVKNCSKSSIVLVRNRADEIKHGDGRLHAGASPTIEMRRLEKVYTSSSSTPNGDCKEKEGAMTGE